MTLPTALSVLVIVGVVALNAGIKSPAFDGRLLTTVVYLVVVIGLYMFVGNSGVVSFGHISFMAIGAYAFGLMTISPTQKAFLLPHLPVFILNLHLGVVPATIAAGLVAACFAGLIGWPICRLSGLAASIGLFAVLVVIYTVFNQADSVTGGQQGLVGVPFDTTLAMAVVWAVVAIFVAAWFQRTQWGMRLRFSREDEFAAQSVGVNVARERVLALVLSAFFVGVGGALYAGVVGALDPSEFYIGATFTTLVYLVVGGMRSLTGAVVGTATVYGVSEALLVVEGGVTIGPVHIPARPGVELVGVAVLGLAILIFRPYGITGGRELRLVGRPGRRHPTFRGRSQPFERSEALDGGPGVTAHESATSLAGEDHPEFGGGRANVGRGQGDPRGGEGSGSLRRDP